METTDQNAIVHVIETAYIQGIHQALNADAVKRGFHPDFRMLVLQEDGLNSVTVDSWLQRLETMQAEGSDFWKTTTTSEITVLDVTGNAAVAKIEVYKDDRHVFTDYMALYKFEEGWKIVNKIFHRHS